MGSEVLAQGTVFGTSHTLPPASVSWRACLYAFEHGLYYLFQMAWTGTAKCQEPQVLTVRVHLTSTICVLLLLLFAWLLMASVSVALASAGSWLTSCDVHAAVHGVESGLMLSCFDSVLAGWQGCVWYWFAYQVDYGVPVLCILTK